MKIAVLTYSFVPAVIGGAEIFTYNLVRHLARRHEVHLYLPRYYYRRYRAMGLRDSCRVYPMLAREAQLSRVCRGAMALYLKVRQMLYRYDVWQIVGAYPAGYAAAALSEVVPTVLRCHGQDIQKDASLHYGERLQPGVEKRIRAALRRMTRLVALTPSVEDCLCELGVSRQNIVSIPNGVDLERFSAVGDRQRIRRSLGIGDGQSMILTVGRYHPKKGYEYIPEAARLLHRRGHNICWVVVGKGSDAIEGRVAALGLESTVVCKDRIGAEPETGSAPRLALPADGLIALYGAADVFVLPSLLESFGMVLIEAMAAGVPVVTTDAPGCRDVVQHERNGLLARPADPESLACAVERLLDDAGLKQALVAASQNMVREYAWPLVARSYETLYARLAGRPVVSI